MWLFKTLLSKLSLQWTKIQEPNLVTFSSLKCYGKHFDMYCGVSVGRLLLW